MATKGNRAQGAISGAGAGAGIGSMVGGPVGAGVGAGLGALLSLFGNSNNAKADSPELQALVQQQMDRQQQANPMIESVMRLAFSRLPTQDQAGLTPPSYADATQQLGPDLTQSPNGEYGQSPAMRSVLQLMRVRQQMANPLYQAIQHLAQRRMPTAFQGLPGGVGGTYPMPPAVTPGTPNPSDPNDPSNRG